MPHSAKVLCCHSIIFYDVANYGDLLDDSTKSPIVVVQYKTNNNIICIMQTCYITLFADRSFHAVLFISRSL